MLCATWFSLQLLYYMHPERGFFSLTKRTDTRQGISLIGSQCDPHPSSSGMLNFISRECLASSCIPFHVEESGSCAMNPAFSHFNYLLYQLFWVANQKTASLKNMDPTSLRSCRSSHADWRDQGFDPWIWFQLYVEFWCLIYFREFVG